MSADAAVLARRTLELVDIPSESRREGPILEHVRRSMAATGVPLVLDTGEALLYGPAEAEVVLAGHVDTVPAQGNRPGRLDGDGSVHGLGASDMKGGVAVMLELARRRPALGYLFFAREELPIAESALPAVLAAAPGLRRAGLVVMLEPTDCALEVGCLGNINAQLVFSGVAAHSARPWLGRNAAHLAVRGLLGVVQAEARKVAIGPAEYVEVVSVTGIRGGTALNVIPAEVVCDVNFRYAPDRDAAEAEARLRELVGEAAEVRGLVNSPPAPVPRDNPHVDALRAAGADPVRGKQAWTPVAEFAQEGIPAVNFGPGDPAFAHRADERVRAAALARCFDILDRAFGARVDG